MIAPHEKGVEYFSPQAPQLYRIGGEYAPGLATLMGAPHCYGSDAHQWAERLEDGTTRCTKCSQHARLS